MALPLAGIRVIAVEQYGAGPFGTQYLVDMGAEVIKIENPRDGGDVSRAVGPYFLDGVESSTASLFFQGLNGGKKSVTLDLGSADGRAALHRLAADADAVCCNLRGDVPEKLGITYDQLKSANPRLICVHLTAYGRSGPRRTWPGYDYTAQAECGYFSVTGEPGAAPARMGLSVVDFMAGQSLALAVVSGVLRAKMTGEGGDADVTLYDTALFNLNYLGAWYLNAGHVQGREPRSAHPSLTPCQLYRTADGWIYIMCNKEKFFPTLCEHVGRPDLARDPRFVTFADRLKNRDALTGLLDEAFSACTTDAWMTAFDGKVPASPILDVGQALDNPAAVDRIEDVDIDGVTMRRLAPPIRWSGEARVTRRSPRLGEHTEEILLVTGLAEPHAVGPLSPASGAEALRQGPPVS